jgi:tRNA threonylcarbamoyladenosine biosynthesis protein TsaE
MPPRAPRKRPPSRSAPERLAAFAGERRSLRLPSDAPARTVAIGRAIGALVPPGAVISLEGGLGVGKTLLAKGICSGLGVRDEVLSPSFILAEEYRGVVPVVHFDLYRLERLDEVSDIGLFDAVDGRRVVIIEWGDRLPEGAVDRDVEIVMSITGPDGREIVVTAGSGFLAALEEAVR